MSSGRTRDHADEWNRRAERTGPLREKRADILFRRDAGLDDEPGQGLAHHRVRVAGGLPENLHLARQAAAPERSHQRFRGDKPFRQFRAEAFDQISAHSARQTIRDRHVAGRVDRDPGRIQLLNEPPQVRFDTLPLVTEHFVIDAAFLKRRHIVAGGQGDLAEALRRTREEQRHAGDRLAATQIRGQRISRLLAGENQPEIDFVGCQRRRKELVDSIPKQLRVRRGGRERERDGEEQAESAHGRFPGRRIAASSARSDAGSRSGETA